jgi:hypothetical protein
MGIAHGIVIGLIDFPLVWYFFGPLLDDYRPWESHTPPDRVSAQIAVCVATGVGSCLVAAAFGAIASRGGWVQAMAIPSRQKRWPVQRWLLLTGGIVLGCLGISGLKLVTAH